MTKRNRKRPYAERTFASTRTISARRSAGTKHPRESTPHHTAETPFNSPPMNLKDGHRSYSAEHRRMLAEFARQQSQALLLQYPPT